MQFSFTDEQEQFRDNVARFLKENSPGTEVRRLMDTPEGYDLKVWKQMNQELGLCALAIPEEYGGFGFGFVELGLVLEEMGRHLFCSPYFSTAVLATRAILNAGSESQKHALLPDIASGELLATLALCDRKLSWSPADIEMVATKSKEGFELNGVKQLVTDGLGAGLIIVAARLSEQDLASQPAFFVVRGTADGLSRRALDALDPTRKIAEIKFDAVAAELLDGENYDTAFSRTLSQSTLSLSNEMAGGCQYLLSSAVEYAKMRMQFGRTIGSFQAIKHMCADMLLEVEMAKSAAYQAAQAAAEQTDDFAALASLAKACVSDTYIRTAANCIQIHGGIGFTWDNDTHLWYKRAKASEEFLGGPSFHREQYLQELKV